jgi:hypothetical protein
MCVDREYFEVIEEKFAYSSISKKIKGAGGE